MGNILTTPGRRIPDSRVNSVHFIRHYSGHLIWFLFFPVIRCFNSGDSQIDLRTRKQRITWKQILNRRGENGGEIEEKTRRVCKSAKISCFPNTGIMCLLKKYMFFNVTETYLLENPAWSDLERCTSSRDPSAVGIRKVEKSKNCKSFNLLRIDSFFIDKGA